MENRTCPRCDRPLTGRADQRYCSARCRVAANRESKRTEQPKRRRPPLRDKLRNGHLATMKGLRTLADVSRDDRYPRSRKEMDPEIRNTAIYAIREACRVLEEVSPREPHRIVDRGQDMKPMPADDVRVSMESIWEELLHLSDLTGALMMINGKDLPTPRPDVTLERIDAAVVGLIEAREYVARTARVERVKSGRSEVCEMPVPSVPQS